MSTTLQPFSVDVLHTDRTRDAAGAFFTFRARVDVLATDHVDATLMAAQIVATVRADHDGMVLATTIVE